MRNDLLTSAANVGFVSYFDAAKAFADADGTAAFYSAASLALHIAEETGNGNGKGLRADVLRRLNGGEADKNRWSGSSKRLYSAAAFMAEPLIKRNYLSTAEGDVWAVVSDYAATVAASLRSKGLEPSVDAVLSLRPGKATKPKADKVTAAMKAFHKAFKEMKASDACRFMDAVAFSLACKGVDTDSVSVRFEDTNRRAMEWLASKAEEAADVDILSAAVVDVDTAASDVLLNIFEEGGEATGWHGFIEEEEESTRTGTDG